MVHHGQLSEWLTTSRDKSNGQTLDSLLILPIQRIPRYQLLLKELIKQTERFEEYHRDLSDLRNAYAQITEVAQVINERMKDNDRRQMVAKIEQRFDRSLMDKMGENLVIPARYFVTESSENPADGDYLTKHNKHGTPSHIVLFLFNDCLIYGYPEYSNSATTPLSNTSANGSKSPNIQALSALNTPRRPDSARKSRTNRLWGKELLKFGHKLDFDEVFRLDDVPENEYKGLHCLKIYARTHSLWVSFQSKEAKFEWMMLLNGTNQKANNRSIKTVQFGNRGQNKRKGHFVDIAYPVFVPDDYSDRCLKCKTTFTMLTRRHHCYYCGTLACGNCTNYRLSNAWKQHEIVRVCTQCQFGN